MPQPQSNSTTTSKGDWTVLAVLGLAMAVALVLLSSTGQVGSADDQFRQPVRSTLSTHEEGLLGCYLVYERLGVPVGRNFDLWQRRALEPVDILVLVNGDDRFKRNIETGEGPNITEWIRAGGVIICTPNILSDLHELGDPAALFLSETLDELIPEEAAPAEEEPDEEASPALLTGPLTGPLADGLKDVVWDTSTPLKAPGGRDPDVTVLLADEQGPQIAERKIGEGRIIVVAASHWLANKHVADEDNAVLAMNLAGYAASVARSEKLTFDEYHVGFGRPSSGWTIMTRQLLTTPPGWALLCVLAATIGWMIAQGVRFGPRRPGQGMGRRRKLEFVHAVGATCRQVGANGLTFRILFNNFRRRCARRVSLPVSAQNYQIAELLARIGMRTADEYRAVLDHGAAVNEYDRISKGQLRSLLSMLAAVEMEIGNGYSRG